MSEAAEKWKITDEHKETVSKFMTDFWSLVKASYEAPDDEDKQASDHYWSTMMNWADALSKKYNDVILNGIIIGYLDGQGCKANGFTITIDRGDKDIFQ